MTSQQPVEEASPTTPQEERYVRLCKLGTGFFGKVYKVEDVVTHKIYAYKKVKGPGKLTDPPSPVAATEVAFLKELDHPNIIKLIDVWSKGNTVNMILELMVADLEALMRDPDILFGTEAVRSIAHMALSGMDYIHSLSIIHRDIKPNNIMLNSSGILKITDFGTARRLHGHDQTLTPQAVSRWYRAPELCYGSRQYGSGVDVWALACVLAELQLGHPLFQGDTDIAQLRAIYEVIDPSGTGNIPALQSLNSYVVFAPPKRRRPLCSLLPNSSPEWLDLLQKMLALCPSSRATAAECLTHSSFHTVAKAVTGSMLSCGSPVPKRKKDRANILLDECGLPMAGLLTRPVPVTEDTGRQGGMVARRLAFE